MYKYVPHKITYISSLRRSINSSRKVAESIDQVVESLPPSYFESSYYGAKLQCIEKYMRPRSLTHLKTIEVDFVTSR